jgi:hypothetical protein
MVSQARLRIVRPEEVVAVAVPWYQARWLKITGQVLWWLLTFLLELAVAVVCAAAVIISVVLTAIGVMAHFAGNSR